MSTSGTGTRVLPLGRIGESVLRSDGRPKVRGEFAYASDLGADRMLWGATLRSPHPSALIRGIDITAAITLSGVAFMIGIQPSPSRTTHSTLRGVSGPEK